MTIGNGYRSLPQSAIINTPALPLSLKAFCAWLLSMQKYPKKTANELIIAAQTADPCYMLITTGGEMEFSIVLFCFHTLSQSACWHGVEFMAEGQIFSLFLPLEIRGIKLCMNVSKALLTPPPWILMIFSCHPSIQPLNPIVKHLCAPSLFHSQSLFLTPSEITPYSSSSVLYSDA